MVKRQDIGDMVFVGRADSGRFAQPAFVLRRFVTEQVPFPGAVPHDFAGGADLEPLDRCFLRFR